MRSSSKYIFLPLIALLVDSKAFLFSISMKRIFRALALDSSLLTLHAEVNGISNVPIYVPRFLASSYGVPFSAQPTAHTCNAQYFLLAASSNVVFRHFHL